MIENSTHVDRTPIQPATVTLTIPCLAEYVSVARLAILGIASRMPFSYDEVEDVRLAVGEACTHAVERAALLLDAGAIGQKGSGGGDQSEIRITSKVSPSSLEIVVSDNVQSVPAMVSTSGSGEFEDPDLDHTGLGALLIEILVDEVEIDTRQDGTTVRLLKNAPEHH